MTATADMLVTLGQLKEALKSVLSNGFLFH